MSSMKKKQPKITNPKLVIPFAQEEVEQLLNGQTFKWTIKTDEGQDIDVLMSIENEEAEIEEEGSEDDEHEGGDARF